MSPSTNEVVVWDASSIGLEMTQSITVQNPTSVDIHDELGLVIGTADGSVLIYRHNNYDRNCVYELAQTLSNKHTGSVKSVSVQHKSRMIVTLGQELIAWDMDPLTKLWIDIYRENLKATEVIS